METFSTVSVPRSSKVAYWNEVNSSAFTPLHIEPVNPEDFEAELCVETVGPVVVASISSLPAVIECTASDNERAIRHWYSLHLSLRGRLLMSHYGRKIVFEEGDFALCHNTSPCRFSCIERNESLAVGIPPEILTRYVPYPEKLCGLHMSGKYGMGHMVSVMLQSLWMQARQGIPKENEALIIGHVLEVIGSAYAMAYKSEVSDSAVTSVRKAQIKRYVENHLRESSLSVTDIATHLGVSARYLRMVFSSEQETITEYVLRRRLEECAQQIADPLWRGHTIIEMALNWGFTNAAHFTRVFKNHFGVSPREYRRMHGALRTSTPPLQEAAVA